MNIKNYKEDRVIKEKSLYIGEVAGQIGINTKTIRYYEEINLLPESERIENNYRVYSKDTVQRLRFIKKAQGLGFTLREIKEILTLRDSGVKPCNHVRVLLAQKIIDIEQKLAELASLRGELKKLEDSWTKMKTVKDDNDEGICRQIEGTSRALKKKPSRTFRSEKVRHRIKGNDDC